MNENNQHLFNIFAGLFCLSTGIILSYYYLPTCIALNFSIVMIFSFPNSIFIILLMLLIASFIQSLIVLFFIVTAFIFRSTIRKRKNRKVSIKKMIIIGAIINLIIFFLSFTRIFFLFYFIDITDIFLLAIIATLLFAARFIYSDYSQEVKFSSDDGTIKEESSIIAFQNELEKSFVNKETVD